MPAHAASLPLRAHKKLDKDQEPDEPGDAADR